MSGFGLARSGLRLPNFGLLKMFETLFSFAWLPLGAGVGVPGLSKTTLEADVPSWKGVTGRNKAESTALAGVAGVEAFLGDDGGCCDGFGGLRIDIALLSFR